MIGRVALAATAVMPSSRLVHSQLSFLFNTVIVAFSINLATNLL